MKKSIFFCLLILFLSPVGQAGPVVTTSTSLRGIMYRVEPFGGIEQVYRSTPTNHTTTRAIYGLRFSAGTERISAEGEYAKGEDTEKYNVAPQSITYKDDSFKLGARTTYNLSNLFFLTGRAGAQAQRTIKETTTNGVLVSVENPIDYSPYAGAAVGVRLGKVFTLSGGTNVVFKDLGDLTKNIYQTTLSIGIGTN